MSLGPSNPLYAKVLRECDSASDGLVRRDRIPFRIVGIYTACIEWGTVVYIGLVVMSRNVTSPHSSRQRICRILYYLFRGWCLTVSVKRKTLKYP